MRTRLTREEFEDLVDEALDSVPAAFDPYLENVIVEVVDRPTREQRDSVALEPGMLLLGLYQGVPLTDKSVTQPLDWPERVLLFHRNIEAVCRTRREIVEEVRRTVLHEIGHHFGMDEQDLDELGY